MHHSTMRLSRQDLRLAIRSFARHPGFAITAIISLALAIALNTTMYSVLDAMVRPHVDIREPERFYRLQLFRDWRRPLDARRLESILAAGGQTFDGLSTYQPVFGGTVIEHGDRFAVRLGARVGTNLFSLYGVRPLRGRIFADGDEALGAPPVIITSQLAHELSPHAELPIGARLTVDGTPRQVVGIIERAAFDANGQRSDVFFPVRPAFDIVRLRPGATIAQANSEFTQLAGRIAAATGDDPSIVGFILKPLVESQFQPMRFHFALIASVIAVLLIACANLANLQLARGIARSRELALRTALGASRRDIIAQLLLESAVIAAAGVAAGILLTIWGVGLLQSRVPPAIADYVIEPRISWRVFIAATAAGLVAVLLIGLLPSVRVSRVDPNDLLKSGAGTGANRQHRRQYGVLVAAQIGFALALLCGTSLVVRTAIAFRTIDMGYDVRPIVAGTMGFRASRDTTFNAAAYEHALLATLRADSDVVAAAVTRRAGVLGKSITVTERGGTPHEYVTPTLGAIVTTADYFRTLHLPILEGRNFPDGLATIPEVIIDEHTAKKIWPGVDPIGQQLKLGEYRSDAPWLTVVGVVPNVNDAKQMALYNVSINPSKVGAIYISETAADQITLSTGRAAALQIYIRARTSAERVAPKVWQRLKQAPLSRFAWARPIADDLGLTRARIRHDFVASIYTVFAVIALALAALGIYGIVAHSVAERTREIGVRIALGATARDVLHAVLREGNAIALAGVAFGLLMTKYTAGWLQAFIFEDDQYNAPVFALVAAALFVVAVASALGPALRATRIDPVESLRSE
jgi:predicted permease